MEGETGDNVKRYYVIQRRLTDYEVSEEMRRRRRSRVVLAGLLAVGCVGLYLILR